MANAKKLPSGKWRVLAYEYTDGSKKRHYKSFTASTKKEAEYMAAEYLSGKFYQPENCTLYEAITRYIESKEGVLSPSTIRGYLGLQKNYFQEIGSTSLKDLNNTSLQFWISDLSKKVSPKTVRNAHGLMAAVLDMFAPDFKLKTTLPAKKKPDIYCPSDEDIIKLLKHIEGTELEIAVLLAAFGTLRRGEICALTAEDITGNRISVNKSMVMNADGKWIIKQPKTYGSYREVEMPPFLISKITRGKISGRIISCTPAAITTRFERALKSTALPPFRFHDLRHYSASIMHAIGIPDQYIMERGGWVSDNVMKSVYRNTISPEKERQKQKLFSHLETMQHEMQHNL